MDKAQLDSSKTASLLLGGGVGLGAFQVGAFDVLHAAGIKISSVSGASIGAINGAIIAGNAPDDRVASLQSFWKAISVDTIPAGWLDPWGLGRSGRFRRMRNWVNAATTGFAGSPLLFLPRLLSAGRDETRSLYDNEVATKTLARFIDFDRLNSGETRFCLATTDIIAGEAVFFDTAKGHKIQVEHILASSSLIPAFEPVRIEGRLLADGGLSCNLPLEAEIGYARTGQPAPTCFALDLFTAGGGPAVALNKVAENSMDLLLGMQTRMRLDALVREWTLRSRLEETTGSRHEAAGPGGVDVFYMSYRGSPDDAGFAKPFDLSRETLSERMSEGREAAKRALALQATVDREPHDDLRIHMVSAH